MNDRYAGSSGSIQGDRKLSNPAINAPDRLKIFIFIYNARIGGSQADGYSVLKELCHCQQSA